MQSNKIKKSWLVVAIICLWCTAFFLYFPSTSFQFIDYDDDTILLTHQNLYGQADILESLKEIFFNYFPREEPLLVRDLSWLIDSSLFGFGNPFGYHFTNVLLNSFNVVLVFVFLYLCTSQFSVSLITAFMFSIIPIHVEPVCWVMGRKDLLATFFILSTLILQCINFIIHRKKISYVLYAMSILFTLAACLSKINSVVLCCIIFIHIIFWKYMQPQNRYHNGNTLQPKTLLGSIVYVMPYCIVCFVIFKWYQGVLDEWGMFGRGPEALSQTHLQTLSIFIPVVITKYTQLLLYPFNYAIDYLNPSIAISINFFEYIIGCVILFFYLILGLYLLKKRKDLLFFYLAALVLILPYLNIVYIGIWIANRYLYLVVFCLLTISISISFDIIKRKKIYKISIYTILICYTILFLSQSWLLQKTWQNNWTLWNYEANVVKKPSLLALYQIARCHFSAAERSTDKELQVYHITKTLEYTSKGIKIFEDLDYRRQNDYTTRELVMCAFLFELESRTYLLQKKYKIALPLLEKAFKMAPNEPLIAYQVSKAHFDLAKKCLAEESSKELSFYHATKAFNIFLYFIDKTQHDMVYQPRIDKKLDEFAALFPHLKKTAIQLKNDLKNKRTK